MPRTSDALFIQMAPPIMRMLRRDFAPFSIDDAAAVLGNLGHESGGFKFLQEKKPLIPGSRGGYGWAQWTGPRRKAFEAFCKARDLEPSSPEANYGFLKHELTNTSEKAAIPAVRKAKTLLAKVKAFELKFERASPKYKHYDSRLKWAEKAIKAFNEAKAPPVVLPSVEDDMAQAIREKARTKDAQRALVAFGYPTGGIDGKIGALTTAALAAYRFDRGLPAGEGVDDALLKDMAAAREASWQRPITEERANKPAREIAKGSKTMQASWWAKIALALGIGGGGATQTAVNLVTEDNLSKGQIVLNFIRDNAVFLGFIVVAGVVVWVILKLIDHFRVQGYRTGKIA